MGNGGSASSGGIWPWSWSKFFPFMNAIWGREPARPVVDYDEARANNTYRQYQAEKVRRESQTLEEERKRKAEVKAAEELLENRASQRKKLGINNVWNYNYAIAGDSGVGKSSLLNGLLRLAPGKGGAEVDDVECTDKIKPYNHPKFSRLIFWDLPGAGTIDHPAETYYEDKVLHAFDAIILVTGNRILANELKIAKQSKEAGKAVVFVRSKADMEIINSFNNEKRKGNEEIISMKEAADKFRDKVNINFQSQTQKMGLSEIDILLVSSNAFADSKSSPYTQGNDTTLEGMDEKLLVGFLLATASTRFDGDISEEMKAEMGSVLEGQDTKNWFGKRVFHTLVGRFLQGVIAQVPKPRGPTDNSTSAKGGTSH